MIFWGISYSIPSILSKQLLMLAHNSLGKSKQTNKNPSLELRFGVCIGQLENSAMKDTKAEKIYSETICFVIS